MYRSVYCSGTKERDTDKWCIQFHYVVTEACRLDLQCLPIINKIVDNKPDLCVVDGCLMNISLSAAVAVIIVSLVALLYRWWIGRKTARAQRRLYSFTLCVFVLCSAILWPNAIFFQKAFHDSYNKQTKFQLNRLNFDWKNAPRIKPTELSWQPDIYYRYNGS
jgi:hypothetical protein